jgi:hypothetical protein
MFIGKIHKFEITSQDEEGHWLKLLGSNEQEIADDIFMPKLKRGPSASESFEIGQEIEAFAYQYEDDRILATSLLPVAEVDEFVCLEVVGSENFGAFLDWGLENDLYVPAKKQNTPMHEGEQYLVRICYDDKSGKLYGTTKFASFLNTDEFPFNEGDRVEAIPVEELDLGIRCIVNKKHIGMLYYNEIFSELDHNFKYDAYVKKIREDGLIDLSIQPIGHKKFAGTQQQVLDMLKKSGGSSNLHDKSAPEEIYNELGMSKKAFKAAIGMLYKKKEIIITKSGIELREYSNKQE